MYSYEYDIETGGILLNSTPLMMSKEPRPVYYKELDILGFDQYWNYEKDDTYPYMWAEANNYFYRGRKVAQTKGGSCYTAPEIVILEEPEPNGEPLRFVDIPAMIEKNRPLLESLVQETVKRVFNTYIKYKKKVDVFYVAFSGGKDSIVTLDIVQRTLPHNAFKVLFGDTGMEFPDTYDVVDYISDLCKKENIEFIRSQSDYKPYDSWNLFGPPATVTRWCCSVHKTSPQVLALRHYTEKSNFTGMAFIGIRASESASRSEYDYVSLGEKHKGQYSFNPILEWNSAELYTYIYMENLFLNNAYKKGNRRAGCLVCPRAAEKNEYIARACYRKEFDNLMNIVSKIYEKSFDDKKQLNDFLCNGGWKARKNGRDLNIQLNYSESTESNYGVISITNPKTPWKEWIKTIGVLINDVSPYSVIFRGKQYSFNVTESEDTVIVKYASTLVKENPLFIKLLKNVFRKSACCVKCRECEADCHNGFIDMSNGQFSISDECKHCSECHKVEKGCFVYKSLELPNGGSNMLKKGSLNCYSHHAPKLEWFEDYFKLKEEFHTNYTLGSQMYNFFKRFLRDADLLDGKQFTHTAEILNNIGLDNESSWAIMLSNLAYSPQINWIVKRLSFGEEYSKDYTLSLLVEDGAKESWVKDIWSSFSRLVELPLGNIGIGSAVKEKNKMVGIIRTPWQNPDPRVILYSLYKFAEECGNYYQFTLSRLLNHDIDSDGVSPTQIFGLEREQMEQLLNGLSINYPDFINVSFTHDLDNITLRSEKTSKDVLSLF